jgi:hypothetical protein
MELEPTSMNAPAAFGLTVRVIGLLAFLYGLYQLLGVVLILVSAGTDVLPIRYPLLMAAFSIAVGFYLLRGAPLIQRIAYGD